jgi:hypothetical protein
MVVYRTHTDVHAAFRLPAELLAAVDAVCSELDLTRSQVFRRSVAEHIRVTGMKMNVQSRSREGKSTRRLRWFRDVTASVGASRSTSPGAKRTRANRLPFTKRKDYTDRVTAKCAAVSLSFLNTFFVAQGPILTPPRLRCGNLLIATFTTMSYACV